MLLLLCQVALAKNYWVKSEVEFKNILSEIKAGDVITIANGTYNNWNIEISLKGTLEKPILIKAEESGKVMFTGNTTQTLFKVSGSYTTLTGLLFKRCELIKADGKSGLLIDFNNAENCTLIDCSFVENLAKAQFMPLVIISGKGISNSIERCVFQSNVDCQDLQVKITKDSAPQYTLITRNLFQNKKRVSWKNGNGGECVQIGQDPILLGNIIANTIVKENKFDNCNGESEIISNKSSKNSYISNNFINNDGELVMRGGHDCIIDRNYFEGGTGGIRINGTGHRITNNKIKDIKTAIRLMYGMAKGKLETGFYIAASDCLIKGNEIINATTGILIGDSKNVDWTGKFDTARYPSPVMQSIAPFDNKIVGNKMVNTKNKVVLVER